MNYLRDLKLHDIDLLIDDLKLMKKGYKFKYAIDAFDVFDYCFPYGITFGQLRSKKINEVGDSLTAYHYIFHNYKPIIMDEYENELISHRMSIKMDNDRRLRNDVLEATLKNDESPEDVKKELSKRATFLLVTSIMQKSMIEKFDEVCSTKLVIISSKKNEEEFILKAFNESKSTEWSSIVFKKLVESQQIKNYSSRIINNLKSTRLDIGAIDKLCVINKKINDPEKNIILYFSGANKSQKLFRNVDILDNLPVVEGKKYNILRAPKHSFIMFLTHNNNPDKMIQNLEKVKKDISRIRHFSKDEFVSEFIEFHDSDSKFNELENNKITLQVKQVENFRVKIEQKIHKLNSATSTSEIARIYQNFLDDAIKANEQVTELQWETSYLLHEKFADTLRKIHKNKIDLYKTEKGLDLIKGTYHHLPILMFFDKNSIVEDKNLDSLFISIVDLAITSSFDKKLKALEFFENIKDIYLKIKDDNNNVNHNEEYYEILIKIFLYVIIESSDKISENTLQNVVRSYEVLLTDQTASSKWKDDFLYFMVWLNRRINNISESEKYCEIAMRDFPDDPRFKHGKCLILYNRNYRTNSLESCQRKDLITMVAYAEDAINGYNKLLKDKETRKEFLMFIKGNISALHNLILYTNSLYYLSLLENGLPIEAVTIGDKMYSIENLRKFNLEYIKDFEMIRGNEAKEWPEYCHTEAVFELVEGLSGKSAQKLDFAEKEIKKAIKIKPEIFLYSLTEEKIKYWKKNL